MNYKTSDFDYQLPPALIASEPLLERTESRLLCLNKVTGSVNHRVFKALEALLMPEDLLVLNDTRVIPARLYGQKTTGGRVECLVERLSDQEMLAHLRASKTPKPGQILKFADAFAMEVVGRAGDLFQLRCLSTEPLLNLLERYGEMPLPPYIQRSVVENDQTRYQTVYAKHKGAVAAPTAGLHFDETLLDRLSQRGIAIAYVTLHVGAGTFQPVRTENLSEHVMHKERISVSSSVCDAVSDCRRRGGRVVAVGTTVVRSLETAAQGGELEPFEGETQLFITPGYTFRVVDALVTNFHLPKSTLLMLVCAFGGYENVMNAYREAIEKRYRFYSYGDAMFLAK